jgi:hypothetical protein
MALSNLLAENGHPPESLRTHAGAVAGDVNA